MVKNVGLCFILQDLCNNISWRAVLFKFLLSVVFLYFQLSYCNVEYSSASISILSTLNVTMMGFGIAAIAIVLGFSKEIVMELSNENDELKKDQNKNKGSETKGTPFGKIVGDISFYILMNAINIILLLALLLVENQCVYNITITLSLFNILWSMHIALHLFALRTFKEKKSKPNKY